MTAITFDRVTKVYRGGTVAVRELDLVVQDGELFVLLGASGSGKTTVLRLTAGLESVTEGTILLGDDDVTELAPSKRDVAMVFQNLALYPHMTVYDNIAFGVRSRRLPRSDADARVRRAASMLGLDQLLGRKPAALSGGQKQRVALGRAIVRDPRAFLMDEPLSSLDERLRGQLRDALRRIQDEMSATMVYVTHERSEAAALGDRVGVMREGILQQADTPTVLYEHPANLFVAGIVGTPPMNIAEGRIERTDGDDALAVVIGGHRLRLDGDTLSARPGLAGYEGRDVAVGVRPHDLRVADAAVPSDARLRVPVAAAEQIGGDTYVRFVIDAPSVLSEDGQDIDLERFSQTDRVNLWTARVKHPATIGEVVELAVARGRFHVFDASTGRSINV